MKTQPFNSLATCNFITEVFGDIFIHIRNSFWLERYSMKSQKLFPVLGIISYLLLYGKCLLAFSF